MEPRSHVRAEPYVSLKKRRVGDATVLYKRRVIYAQPADPRAPDPKASGCSIPSVENMEHDRSLFYENPSPERGKS